MHACVTVVSHHPQASWDGQRSRPALGPREIGDCRWLVRESTFQGACGSGVRMKTWDMRETGRLLWAQSCREGHSRPTQLHHPDHGQDSCAGFQTSGSTFSHYQNKEMSGYEGAGPESVGDGWGRGRVWVTHSGSGLQPATRHPLMKAEDDLKYRNVGGCCQRLRQAVPGAPWDRSHWGGRPSPEAWLCSSPGGVSLTAEGSAPRGFTRAQSLRCLMLQSFVKNPRLVIPTGFSPEAHGLPACLTVKTRLPRVPN